MRSSRNARILVNGCQTRWRNTIERAQICRGGLVKARRTPGYSENGRKTAWPDQYGRYRSRGTGASGRPCPRLGRTICASRLRAGRYAAPRRDGVVHPQVRRRPFVAALQLQGAGRLRRQPEAGVHGAGPASCGNEPAGRLARPISVCGPVFRYPARDDGERPDNGQFWQCGAEIVGPRSAAADGEIIAMAMEGLSSAGARNPAVTVGHVGADVGCAEAVRAFGAGQPVSC